MSTLFHEALEHFGISYKTTRKSIILKDCPACSRSKHSVWMYIPEKGSGRTGGQCWVCGERFSSYSYLKDFGHDPVEIRNILKIGKLSPDLNAHSWELPSLIADLDELNAPEEVRKGHIPSHFFKVRDWPTHPASKYAIGRGIVGLLADQVYIDPFSNAVAFQVHSDDLFVGFQRRYVDPQGPKTRTDPNLPKRSSFIHCGHPSLPLCVVEGPFDAVAAAWLGYHGVATMGAEVSRGQAQRLAMIAMEVNPQDPTVFIGFDRDEPGEVGGRKLAKMLDAYGIKVKRVVPLEEGEDLGSMLQKYSGLDFTTMEEMVLIDGLTKVLPSWNWDVPMIGTIGFGGMKPRKEFNVVTKGTTRILRPLDYFVPKPSKKDWLKEYIPQKDNTNEPRSYVSDSEDGEIQEE